MRVLLSGESTVINWNVQGPTFSDVAFTPPTSHLKISESQHQCHIVGSTRNNTKYPQPHSLTPTRQQARKNASFNLPAGHSHPTFQLTRLVQPTAPSPANRSNSMFRQDRAGLLSHQLRTAIHYRRRPQAIHQIMRMETELRGRECARNW